MACIIQEVIVSVFCDKCRYKNRDTAKFCKSCGADIIATEVDGTLQKNVILDNRYKIVRLLKSGGMGAVYQALDGRFDDTLCAVKEMLDLTAKPEEKKYFVDRFKKEALILHNLRHANLPVVKDYFIEAGRYYLVMDFIEGRDLETILKEDEEKGLPPDMVVKWAIQILDVLDYLHNQNPPVIYRDLKPSNVMLNSDGVIKLIDFGIARTVTPGTEATMTGIGTPVYAPKEILMGKPEKRSDIYSLGATMHSLLTGIIPAVPGDFLPLRKYKPNISGELENIIMKSLSINLDDRYSSAGEMRLALEKISVEKSSVSDSSPLKTLKSASTPYTPTVRSVDSAAAEKSSDSTSEDYIPTTISSSPSSSNDYVPTTPQNLSGKTKKKKSFLSMIIIALSIMFFIFIGGITGFYLFISSNYEEAAVCYSKAIELFDSILKKDSDDKEQEAEPSPTTFSTTVPTISPAISPTVLPAPSPIISPTISPTVLPAPSPIISGSDFTSPSGIKLVYIGGGTFEMGSDSDDEQPIHTVEVSSFYIGKYEVTNNEYKKFNPSHNGSSSQENYPVESVNWYDAVNYCNWLSMQEGLDLCYSGLGDDIILDISKNGYRLPTEAEWEYACRSGSDSAYYWGNTMDGAYCWYDENSGDTFCPVGERIPNSYGLYDMSGNVWEWCWDWYGETYYSDSPYDNPVGPVSGSERIGRGGDWSGGADDCRSARRYDFHPGFVGDVLGFRLVRSGP